jgi:uncharacterized membrane protein
VRAEQSDRPDRADSVLRSAVARYRSAPWLDKVFWAGVVLKGLDGVVELVGAAVLFAMSPSRIHLVAVAITRDELSEDPHDRIANEILRLTNHLSGSQTLFGAAYLLLHGIVKVVLVVALLRDKLWAYPWMIAFLAAFIGYQVLEIVRTGSLPLVALTAVDAVLCWLTWVEYGKHRRRHADRAIVG